MHCVYGRIGDCVVIRCIAVQVLGLKRKYDIIIIIIITSHDHKNNNQHCHAHP
jgi:hypothetical protein